MVALIVTALLPIALRILAMFFDKKVNDVESKQKFYDLVKDLNDKGIATIPASLKKSYDAQSARLDALEKEV